MRDCCEHGTRINGPLCVDCEAERAVRKERKRIVKIIRDACFRGMGNRPEPTWQDIIEKIEKP